MATWEFKNVTSMIESAKIEIIKGNKIVMYEENGKFILIVWETYKG